MTFLGIDTSNYAASVALTDEKYNVLAKSKIFLPVKEGQLGLRQSDAVFSHVQILPKAINQMLEQTCIKMPDAIGVSSRPRNVEGSYMPCFSVGLSFAESLGALAGLPVYSFSHQQGHFMAALKGCGLEQLESYNCIGFHVSGGTTDAVLCSLHRAELNVTELASSMDLYAGQVVDRVGQMFGFPFPSGEYVSNAAERSDYSKFARPVIKENGCCCLSGLENQCKKLSETESKENVCRFALGSIANVISEMATQQRKYNGDLPVVFAGGVMSSSVIRKLINNTLKDISFAEPAWLSGDNAVGTAILASRRYLYHE